MANPREKLSSNSSPIMTWRRGLKSPLVSHKVFNNKTNSQKADIPSYYEPEDLKTTWLIPPKCWSDLVYVIKGQTNKPKQITCSNLPRRVVSTVTHSFITSLGEIWQRELTQRNPVSRTNRLLCDNALSRSCHNWDVTWSWKFSPQPSISLWRDFIDVSRYLLPEVLFCKFFTKLQINNNT